MYDTRGSLRHGTQGSRLLFGSHSFQSLPVESRFRMMHTGLVQVVVVVVGKVYMEYIRSFRTFCPHSVAMLAVGKVGDY